MSGVIDLATRRRDSLARSERAQVRLILPALVNLMAAAACYLDSRTAREFLRTMALMLPSLIDLLSKHPNQPTACGLAHIYTAIKTAVPHRANELREQGRALANELGLSIFAPLFDDNASGYLDARIFNAKALADLVEQFKRADT
jgi:hypothetical protein